MEEQPPAAVLVEQPPPRKSATKKPAPRRMMHFARASRLLLARKSKRLQYTKAGVRLMNAITGDVIMRLANKARRIAELRGRTNLSNGDLTLAVKHVFPPALAQAALAHAREALEHTRKSHAEEN
jgi:hypothetical protein